MDKIKRQGLYVALPLLAVVTLVAFWEFYLEQVIAPLLFDDYRSENLRENLGYIAISLAASLVAMATLGGVSYWLAGRKVQAERALNSSENRFRDLVEGSILATMIRGKTGERLYVNQAFLDLFGYGSVEEVIASTARPLTASPDEKERLENYRLTRMRGEDAPDSYEFTGQKKDGSIVPIQTFVRNLVWDGRDAIQNIYIDITERKSAEQALQDSETRFRNLIEGSQLGIQIGAPEKGRIFVNRACWELFGYAGPEDLMQTPGLELIAEHDRERVATFSRDLYQTAGTTMTYEFDGLRKDGAIIPMQAFARHIQWDGQDAVQRTFVDLTLRKQTEKALQESEERFSAVFDNSPAAVSLKDRDGRYRLINRRYQEWFGFTQEKMLGKTLAEIFDADYAERAMSQENITMETGETTEREQQITFASGETRIATVVKFPVLNRDQQSIGIGTLITDVTEERRTAAQLRQAQKMEAIGQLTGGVAHDFNNLLTVIQGNLELIIDHLEGDEVIRMANNAIRAAGRGAELTQRLLAYSRRQILAPAVIDLNDLVSGMVALTRRALGETIEIEIRSSDDLWHCHADPGQLENAILNLSLNARDAMARGGRMVIETANVTLDDAETAAQHEVSPGDFVMVSISDSGSGMTDDVLDHAFEPFFTTKGVGEGSGLGLSMVHGFIRQSDGYLTIDSNPAIGTVVKLYLPRAKASSAVREEEGFPAKGPASRGERILVVEDDPDLRTLTVSMLAELGYDIVQAGDGKEALETLESTPGIDLIFTDIVLPGGMNGADIASEAARRFPGIKIIFTSGYAEHILARQGDIDPNIRLLKKPFRIADLAREVRAVLNPS